MRALDGLYRHAGTFTTWDESGITVRRDGHSERLPWTRVKGARRLQSKGSYVQLIVGDHPADADLAQDPFAIPVASEPDANRLMTTLDWRAQGRNRPV